MDFLIILLLMLVPLAFRFVEKAMTKNLPSKNTSPMQSELPPMEKINFPMLQEEGVHGTKEVLLTEGDSLFKKEEALLHSDPLNVEKAVPLSQEQLSQDKLQKIDPKKMIIYSEIMKPKF